MHNYKLMTFSGIYLIWEFLNKDIYICPEEFFLNQKLSYVVSFSGFRFSTFST